MLLQVIYCMSGIMRLVPEAAHMLNSNVLVQV